MAADAALAHRLSFVVYASFSNDASTHASPSHDQAVINPIHLDAIPIVEPSCLTTTTTNDLV